MRVANPRVRTLLAAFAVILPRALRRFVWRRLLGYDIDATASIGHSFIDVDAFRAGPGASVASFSMVRGCERVEMEAETTIGPFVWVNAVRTSNPVFFPGLARETALVMRHASVITCMHFIDCCDRIELKEYSALGGLQSQLLAHAFSVERGALIVGPITIGAYTIVGTRTVMLPNTEIGEKCVVGAGSVLTGGTYEPLSLHAGVPAVRKTGLAPDAGIFVRQGAVVR